MSMPGVIVPSIEVTRRTVHAIVQTFASPSTVLLGEHTGLHFFQFTWVVTCYETRPNSAANENTPEREYSIFYGGMAIVSNEG
jgi:hypothetical protein